MLMRLTPTQYLPATKPKLVALALAITLLPGCSAIREVTYPSEFVYLEQADVQTSMQQMSVRLARIQGLLRQVEDRPGAAGAVVSELQGIEDITRGLAPGSTQTNHLLIDQNIDRFRAQVSRALLQAKAEPPSFFETGQLIGACNGCHTFRDEDY